MNATMIAKFENEEFGTAAMVWKIDAGYSVVLRDTDAGETVSTVIYPDVDRAIAKAKEVL